MLSVRENVNSEIGTMGVVLGQNHCEVLVEFLLVGRPRVVLWLNRLRRLELS